MPYKSSLSGPQSSYVPYSRTPYSTCQCTGRGGPADAIRSAEETLAIFRGRLDNVNALAIHQPVQVERTPRTWQPVGRRFGIQGITKLMESKTGLTQKSQDASRRLSAAVSRIAAEQEEEIRKDQWSIDIPAFYHNLSRQDQSKVDATRECIEMARYGTTRTQVDELKALQATVDKTVDPQRCERIDGMILHHLGTQIKANEFMDATGQEEIMEIQEGWGGAKITGIKEADEDKDFAFLQAVYEELALGPGTVASTRT